MYEFDHSNIADDGSLKWYDGEYSNIIRGGLFLLFIATPFLLYMNDDNLTKYLILTGMITTFIYSVIVHKQTWQSNWCFFTNATNVFILLRPYLL
jgi:hypothetical protein